MPIFYRPNPDELPITGTLKIVPVDHYIEDHQLCKFGLKEACCQGMYNGLTIKNPIVQFIFHPDVGTITMGDDYLGTVVFYCPFCGTHVQIFEEEDNLDRLEQYMFGDIEDD